MAACVRVRRRLGGDKQNPRHLWKPQVAPAKAVTHSMKIKNVFDEIFSMENLSHALEDASAGRRYNRDVLIFNFDDWANLKDLREEIYSGTYHIDKYFIFYVYEPKKRMIMSIAFRHRVVQWAIYRKINPIFTQGYIRDSYGCIDGRGSVRAMKRLRYWLTDVNRGAGSWYYLKLDISKYFYRISHRVLKKILRKKISDKRLLDLLDGIIDCPHTPFGLPPGKSPGEVEPSEMLYDVGMPIGNLLSQVFANLYLDALDQYAKRTLGIKHYIRYMDDVIILCDSKEKLRVWKDLIEIFLLSELELHLNKKTCIRPINQGIEFVGYRVWPDRAVLRKSTSLKIKRSLKGVAKKYAEYEIDLDGVAQTLASYLGMMEHCDSEALQKKILDEFILQRKRNETQEPIHLQPPARDLQAAP